MADCYPKETRSRVMSRIRSRNTRPEILLRKCLWKQGCRGYRIHDKRLPGKPDIVFPSKKIAIFVDGCFWHQCPECYVEPKSNRDYWIPKIESNIERDRKHQSALESMGYTVIRVWEHEIKKNLDSVCERILKTISYIR